MNSLHLSRCALSTCVAALVLADCGGSQSMIQGPGAIPKSDRFRSPDESHTTPSVVSNHVFSAAYSGHYTCLIGLEGSFGLFVGSGTASIPGFRRKSAEALGYHPCDHKKGSFTLTSRSSGDTITGRIIGDACSADTYTVTGGTGRYTGATGSGTVTVSCPSKNEDYKDVWSGTISY
jgi:hypothetical protein